MPLANGAPIALLDAIEATLRQRIQGWRRTGQIFAGLEGWEIYSERGVAAFLATRFDAAAADFEKALTIGAVAGPRRSVRRPVAGRAIMAASGDALRAHP